MSQPTGTVTPPGSLPTTDDIAIRERAREITAQVFQEGRVDSTGVRNLVNAVTGRKEAEANMVSPEARQAFANAVRILNEALLHSANQTHTALARLASRGQDFTDNDLKDALVSMRKLQENYIAVSSQMAEAASGNLRGQINDLAAQAQNVGAEAAAQVATAVGQIANQVGNASTASFETARTATARMALLASGMLAGLADAMRSQSDPAKK